ncbi:hypothetical protein HPB48_026355 [Haemaphysalis longicornis]|uniref:Uncharacterized protein n=1 Tax=Haemaphysalis longicornis TaxID=44386 RepID=A0A9J6HAJ1_HAELO|nr:hypothetical protein HPB48_026355 [Haemaphysalis longicornis]
MNRSERFNEHFFFFAIAFENLYGIKRVTKRKYRFEKKSRRRYRYLIGPLTLFYDVAPKRSPPLRVGASNGIKKANGALLCLAGLVILVCFVPCANACQVDRVDRSADCSPAASTQVGPDAVVPATDGVKEASGLTRSSAGLPRLHGRLPLLGVPVDTPQKKAPQGSGTAADYDFGYPRGSPCVFIQFANVSGWDPEPPSLNDSSQVLPEELQPLLKPELLPLHCDGDTPADRENIGDLVYSPYQGFRTEFFPYTGHRDYMPPLVAVQFRRPEIGVLIGVRCRLWARNPPPGKVSTEIMFHLLVD